MASFPGKKLPVNRLLSWPQAMFGCESRITRNNVVPLRWQPPMMTGDCCETWLDVARRNQRAGDELLVESVLTRVWWRRTRSGRASGR